MSKLLLEGAVVAHAAQEKLARSDRDHAFYEGKQQAALYFAHYVLPGVHSRIETIMSQNRSPLDIPDEAFATL